MSTAAKQLAVPTAEPWSWPPQFPIWYDHPEYDHVIDALNATISRLWDLEARAQAALGIHGNESVEAVEAGAAVRSAVTDFVSRLGALDPSYLQLAAHLVAASLKPPSFGLCTNAPQQTCILRRASDRN